MSGEEASFDRLDHIYYSVLLNPHASHRKGQPEVAFE